MIYDSLQDALAAVSAALAAGSVGRSRNGGFELAGGKATFVFKNWSTDNYVLMPAAAYNGNRFRAVNGYWPEAVTDPSPDMPVTVSNIHQLNFGPGPSRIALKGGDFSTPAVGLQFPNTKLGCWLLADQGCRVTLEEADDRRTASPARLCRLPRLRLRRRRLQLRPEKDPQSCHRPTRRPRLPPRPA